MTLYQNPLVLDELEESIGYLLKDVYGHKMALQMLSTYSSLSEELRQKYLLIILSYGYTKEASAAPSKNAILEDLKRVFPTYIQSSSLRDGGRAQAFLNYARLDLQEALKYFSLCEHALSESTFKGGDLAFIRKHCAPLSKKVARQCALLEIRDYKAKTSDENIANINVIFEVFDDLSPKLQKQMTKLCMTILEYVYAEIGHMAYMGYVHTLLEIIGDKKARLNDFPGICAAALHSPEGATPLILEYAFGCNNKIDTSVYLDHVNNYRYAILHTSVDAIHKDYFFHSTKTPSFEEILVSNLYFRQNINHYLIARIHHKPKMIDIIACLRALHFQYLSVYNVDQIYQPLAFLEEKYGFPLKEKIQALILEVASITNNNVQKILKKSKDDAPYEIFNELMYYENQTSFALKLKHIFDELILSIMPASVMEYFKNEALVCETVHPLNFCDNDIKISHYDPVKDIFLDEEQRSYSNVKPKQLTLKVEQLKNNLLLINDYLEKDAIHHGFTEEEMGLYF